MKRSFRIEDIKTYDNRFTLYLNNNLKYSNGETNYIILTGKTPFNNFKVGDAVYINDEDITNYRVSTVFSEDMVNLQ